MNKILNKIIKVIKNPSKILWFLDVKGIIRLSDENFLKIRYKCETGKKLNLNNPKSFNEKLQWLKLNDRKDIYTTMVDKYEIKKYIEEKIGKEYVIPTLGIYDKFDDINFKKLPNQFVIKCTHDSGSVIVIKDKNKMDLKSMKKIIDKSMKTNFYLLGREWPYKNVKAKIIVENYLKDNNSDSLRDYKFFCFNGEPKIMYISEGLENHSTASMDFFDMNFKLSECKRSDYKSFDKLPNKPLNFEKMKTICRILSKDIPHVRVDFYEVNGKLYFGELTFYTCSGFVPFLDEKWNLKLGSFIKIKL